MNLIQQYEAGEIARLTAARAVPEFVPGDTLRVSVNIKEGERSRVQAFEGVCIARSNKGLNSNFTVRKISYGEGVERVFPLYAPTIAAIDVVRRGDVRRAKLYYLRGRRGKSARIAEKARETVEDRSRRVKQGQGSALDPEGDRGVPCTPGKQVSRGRLSSGGVQGQSPWKTRGGERCQSTLFDKVWDAHVVDRMEDGTCVLYIDRHLVHEVTSPQAFEGLRMAGRPVRRPDATIAVVDHNVPTTDRRAGIAEPESRIQVETLERQRRRVRRALHPAARRAPGHRPHHRAGARHLPARHHHRLRRQPHLHPRRPGRAGVRHRHVGGRARARHPDAAAEAGQEHAGVGRGPARPRRHRQGRGAGHHRHASAPPAARGT